MTVVTPRAAIYVRISRDREGASLGVLRQEQDCRARAAELGWEILGVYTDNDTSAYSGKLRRGYRQMLDDVRTGAVNAVMAWHTDRLHRSPVELEEYLDLGVQTVTVKAGELDLTTPAGRMIARQLGAVARYESEHKGERLTRKYQEMAEAGVPRGNGRPFGYERDGTTPHASEALEVRTMMAKVLAGESLASIMRDLNSRAVLTTRGNSWGYSSLRALLLRPRSAGLMVYRGQVVGKGQWTPLVSEEDHLAVQILLNSPGRRTTTGNARAHLLPGLARCGKCGKGMKSGNVKDRYKRDSHLYRCCVYRNEAKLDALVTKVALLSLVHPSVRRALTSTPASGTSIDTRRERDSLHSRLDEAAEAFARGDVTMAQLTSITSSLTARIGAIELSMAGEARDRVLADLMTAEDLLGAWEDLTLSRKRAVIDAIMTIQVMPVGKGSNGTSFLDGVVIRLKAQGTADLVTELLAPKAIASAQQARIVASFGL